MYIRRKVFSILNTEEGERLFSTTDYILDQREFAGETKRRNKALKRQWLEKLGEADGYVLKDSIKERLVKKGKLRFINNNKIDLDAASKIRSGRLENRSSQNSDELARKEGSRKYSPEEFKNVRELDKQEYMNKKSRKPVPQSPKPTTSNPGVVVSNPKPVPQSPKPTTPKPEAVVSNPKPVPQSPKPTTPKPEAVVSSPKPIPQSPKPSTPNLEVASNPKPVIKTESKLSRLAKNKYVRPTSNPKVVVSKETSFTPKKAVSNSKPVINTKIKSVADKTGRRVGIRTAAGLLALGGTAAGGYYLLNKKNKKDKEDRD